MLLKIEFGNNVIKIEFGNTFLRMLYFCVIESIFCCSETIILTLFFLFLSGDCGIFVIKLAKFLMASKSMPKVTPQRMSYFHKKMYLEFFNYVTLKQLKMLRVMMASIEQKFHIFNTFYAGNIFKSILGKFMNIVDFDIFGVYL